MKKIHLLIAVFIGVIIGQLPSTLFILITCILGITLGVIITIYHSNLKNKVLKQSLEVKQ